MNERLSWTKVLKQYKGWIALGLCLLVLAGYLYNLDAWRMNEDEGEYLYQFWRMTEGEMPYRDFLTPQLPVFLYSGMLWMKLVGHNLFLLRMLSVILAFSTAGLIFLLGRRIGNNTSLALAGAFIYLLHPETYRQSRFLRNEAFFLFFGVLGLYLAIESISRRRRWVLALSGISLALATLCKFFGALYVGGIGLFFLWRWVSKRIDWREALCDSLALGLPYGLTVGAILAGFYLAIPIFFQAVLGHHLMQGQTLSQWEVIGKGLKLLAEYASMYPLLVGIALAAAIGDSFKSHRWTFLVCQIPTALAFLVLSRNFGPRHFLYLVPALALLSALGIHTINRLGRWGWSVGIVLLVALLAPWIRTDFMRARQAEKDTMYISEIIQDNSAPDDVVISDFAELNFFAQRRSTYLGAALSIGAASSGQITGAELIQEIVDDQVKMIVIDVQSFARHLSQMPDFATFYRYVRANFDLVGEFRREDQVLQIYHAVYPPTSTADPLHITHAQVANLDGQVTLLGYDVDRTIIHPGETLKLVLYWQAQTRMETDWSVFTHLLGPDGKVWGQMDQLPLKGLFPTSRWGKGEVVDDDYAITASADAPPGEYRLEVGMYNWITGERLAVFDANGQRIAEDRVLLESTITVQ